MNIIVLVEQPQRYLEVISFVKNILTIEQNFKFTILITNKVKAKLEESNIYLDFSENIKFEIYEENSLFTSVKTKQKIIKIVKYLQKVIFVRKVYEFFKISFLFRKVLEKREKKLLLKMYKAEEFLRDKIKNIDIAFIMGDRHLGLEPVVIKLCNLYNVPTLIPFLVHPAEEEDLVKSSKNKYTNSLFVSTYIKKSQERFKHQKRKNKFYYNHEVANALHKYGVLSENPWFLGGGKSQIICLANEYFKSHYTKHGVSQEKIKVIGDTAYDNIYRAFCKKNKNKKIIINKYKLDKSKKILIISLPQLAEHNLLSWDEHWKEIDYIVDVLSKQNMNLLISLHPKMDIKQYLFLEKKYDCRILKERLSDIIPIADIFVSTVSSTILWAVLCGIKTILVDFYKLDLSIYDFLSSIHIIKNKNNFNKKLLEIASQEIDFTEDWKSLSREKVFDGKTIQRYVELIKEVK